MWVDGGARGNPGPAAVGYRIEDDAGEVLAETGETIGTATNNEADIARSSRPSSAPRRWAHGRWRCGRTPSCSSAR